MPREIFDTIKNWALEMGLDIIDEDPANEILVISDEDRGIVNLIVDCEDNLLVMKQMIARIPADPETMKTAAPELLTLNGQLVHGSFALNPHRDKVVWWDTLELAHLDREEFEGSLNALSLAIDKHGEKLAAILG